MATKIYKVQQGEHKGEWVLPEATWNPKTKTKSTKNRYFKSKTDLNNYLKETKTPKKYSKTELNKAAQYFFNKNYDELTVESGEKTKAYDRVRQGEGKFSKITQADPLTEIQQAKILKEYPDAKFTPKNKYGFPPSHENYQKVVAFVTKGFKKPFQGSQLQALPKYAQKELIEAFPEVDFNFNRDTLLRKGSQFSKYGVPVSHPKYSRISKYFAKSKPWKYNFDLRSPEGWMMSQMERNYAQNGEDSSYRPITKKGGPIAKGNPMIGIEHKGKKYNMKTIVNHPDFANTKKYWNIADKTSKKYLSEFDNLAKLLPEGFDSKKIQLNDLLQFISDKDGVKGLNRAKRAIQIHHEYGVGPRATTNYQLLRQDMNLLANKANNLIKTGKLKKIEEGAAKALELNTRLVVDDVRYGPKIVSPTADIKNIIAGAETEMLGFKKKDWSSFEKFLKPKVDYLIAEADAGGPICGLVRKPGAIGGSQQPGCGDEVRQALQEDPDKLIQEAADAKVKSGENTKFRTIARQILSKLPKGGRLGALIAGAGAVGAGAYAMFGGPDARADEPRTTDQDTMKYNSTTGTFDNIDGDPEDQEGILNWIADNPAKAGFSALPAWMGLGYGLSTVGMKRAGQHLMSWKAIIPAMMIPEKMHQWKTGMEAGEMATDPFNALWALGIRGPESLKAAEAYYANMLKQGQRGLDMTTLKSLKNVQGWKNLPGAMRTALMSPAATGTDLAFQKRLKPTLKKLTESIIGSPVAKETAKKGLGALAKRVGIGLGAAALLPATVAAGLISAPLTLGLGALSFGYAQYKDYRDGKAIVDSMRARGKISEEDADKYMSLIKQGSLPFGLGNRLFGDDEMTIRGQTITPAQQREILAGMESQIDLFQDQRQDVRALDRADDFDFFSEGGRVGMKFGGGIDRRGFLKWLATLGATIAGGASGLFKTGAKKGIEQVVKQAPKKFVGVDGMPAWFPRAVQKIKTHGKLIEMADKHYVNGDIYEMILPTQVPKFDMVAGKQKMSGFHTVNKKVLLEDNPVSGEIEISWNVDDFDGNMKRIINFRPGQSGFQKFGVDVENPGAWQYQRVKVEDPEFTYGNPDQSVPERDEFLSKDIFEEGDEVVKALENLTGNKKMVAKDGSIIDTVDEKDVDKVFQKRMYKDIEGEESLLPDPEGHITPDGWSGEKNNPIIEGDVPEWVPKDEWPKKASGGTVETGDIARRQSLVPPLSGPDPQGIMGLYSAPKQVRVG
jgi:hypothetical protein